MSGLSHIDRQDVLKMSAVTPNDTKDAHFVSSQSVPARHGPAEARSAEGAGRAIVTLAMVEAWTRDDDISKDCAIPDMPAPLHRSCPQHGQQERFAQ